MWGLASEKVASSAISSSGVILGTVLLFYSVCMNLCCWRLSHGIGRSGEIAAVQPKAAGSSLISLLTNKLVKECLTSAGLSKESVAEAIVLPFATGMSITFTLLTMKSTNPSARYVVWPRVDQKTCLKAIVAAGLEPVIIDNAIVGDEVCTDMNLLRDRILDKGPSSILCVLSTTMCFAPRAPDRLIDS